MKTKEFLSILRRSPTKQLIFMNEDGVSIHPGYHLTEVKVATLKTVDCGAQKNQWKETIIQLWVPENERDETFMSAGKFLSIYDTVSGMIDVDLAAEIRFEYGDENFFPSNYHVKTVTEEDAALEVQLQPPQTTCKARDRRLAGVSECCK